MRHLILRTFLLALLIASGFQCKKHTSNTGLLTGKLIASDGCLQYVVEVLDGPVDPATVVDTWKDTDNDSVYHNVFRLTGVRDACGIGSYGVVKGDTFTFRMDPNPQHTLCYVCAVMTTLAMPPVSDAIKDINKTEEAPAANGH
ncbi:MAG TPA: hypothetical protein VGM30_21645 [Puia sp.]|jgi:hypothetical protein